VGAIIGRRAKSNKPAKAQQAATKIAIEMRRIIAFFSSWLPPYRTARLASIRMFLKIKEYFLL
jgi:hypothetical protein